MRNNRIGVTALREALQLLSSEGTELRHIMAWTCGPPGMVDDMSAMLTGLGMDALNIKTERWF